MMHKFIFWVCLILLLGCTGEIKVPSVTQVAEEAPPLDPGLQDEIIPLGLSLRTFKGGEAIQGSTTQTVTWYIKTDPAYTEMDPGFYLSNIEISKDNGTTWETPTGGSNIPGVSDNDISYSWSVPYGGAWEGSTFKVRITVRNTKGNRHNVTSESFTIDNQAPEIIAGTFKINSSTTTPYAAKSSSVGIQFQAQDALTEVSAVCLRMGTTAAPAKTDGCWKPFQILGLTPAKQANITGLNQFLGLVGGSFTIYLWIQDRAGNISNLTGAVGDENVDSRVINYSPGNTVSLSKFIASNSDAMGRLPSFEELVIDGSNPSAILKWAYTINAGASLDPDAPISFEYTLDESTYTMVSAGAINPSGINGACTLTDGASGCYAWTVPAALHGKYFRIRLRLKDESGFIYTTVSNPLNTGSFRLLAGNTDGGIGGSASQAVFNISGSALSERADIGSLVVRDDGGIFIRDTNKGVLYINPKDGSLNNILSLKSSSVDGLSSAGASTANLLKLALDYSGNVILLERDRIRRLSPYQPEGAPADFKVETFVGTGSISNRELSGIAASSMKLNITASSVDLFLTPLPNGDIYFSTSSINTLSPSVDIRVYKANVKKVYPVILSGSGTNASGYAPISALKSYSPPGISFNPITSFVDAMTIRWCEYLSGTCANWYASNLNPRTGVANGTGIHYPPNNKTTWGNHPYVTSRRGEIYMLSALAGAGMYKLNTTSKTWTRILGTENVGQCDDGTLATACPVDVTDSFVTSDNIVFFLDRNQLRVIGSDGKVATVFGQSKARGDGGDPLMARFNLIEYISTWGNDDKVIVYDSSEFILREFAPGGNIETLGGNRGRSPAHGWNSDRSSTLAAKDSHLFASYWSNSTGFAADKETGEPVIYTHNGSYYNISKLIRDSGNPQRGKWFRLVGGGTKSFTDTSNNCDGTSNVCKIDGLPPVVGGMIPALNIDGTNLPAQAVTSALNYYNGNSNLRYRCFIKAVQTTDGTVAHFMGNGNDCAGNNGSSVDFASAGVAASTSSNFPALPSDQTRFVYRAADDSLLMARYKTKRIVKVKFNRNATTKQIIGGDTIENFAEADSNILAFNILTDSLGKEWLVYCNTDGVLKKQSVTDGTAPQIMPFPSTSLKCSGRSLEVSADGKKVIFPFTQNGISAVGEYRVFEN